MNISGTFNVLRLIFNPALCLPHHTISTFDQLPIPLSAAFASRNGEKRPDIRAIVLDKDNCFAVPRQNEIYHDYKAKFEELRKAYPGSRLLIVSNSSGTSSDKGFAEAEILERNTGIKVLRHATKKPGCHDEIMDFFRSSSETGVTSASQVAIVGDRLFTDVLMANMMGSHGIWIKDGVIPDHGAVCHLFFDAVELSHTDYSVVDTFREKRFKLFTQTRVRASRSAEPVRMKFAAKPTRAYKIRSLTL